MEQATGLLWRATRPPLWVRWEGTLWCARCRCRNSAASCRRERPSWPCHPDPSVGFRRRACLESRTVPLACLFRGFQLHARQAVPQAGSPRQTGWKPKTDRLEACPTGPACSGVPALSRNDAVEVWVEQATGLLWRATRPPLWVRREGNFGWVRCRCRERPSWPCHPDPSAWFRRRACLESRTAPLACRFRGFQPHARQAVPRAGSLSYWAGRPFQSGS